MPAVPPSPPSPSALSAAMTNSPSKNAPKKFSRSGIDEIPAGPTNETIDAAVSNAGDALRALAKLREGIQTLPFFGGGKVVWLQNCNFLGEERAAAVKDVTETLADLSAELKTFDFATVRLLISAGKSRQTQNLLQNPRRNRFRRTLRRPLHRRLKDWAAEAESMAFRALKALKKTGITDEALAKLVGNVGPNARLLNNEIEKLALYVGDRPENRHRRRRHHRHQKQTSPRLCHGRRTRRTQPPLLLKCLDEELWEVRRDPGAHRSVIGLLYGLISKIRTMILAKELMAQG